MGEIKDLFQTADWKVEKHVPVISLPDKIKKDELVKITVSVGKEIPHPNTTEHHIGWIELFFLPSQGRFPYSIGRFEFSAHGASSEGPNTSSIYTQPEVVCTMKSGMTGTVLATSFCNIHGLWTSSAELKVED
ncbi:MAG: class II SORL domain-containing protein [Thermoplasmata archaeon]|nr:MAG: class II SORL domain-containing protein [Thermoplasmata archaeon]